MEGLETQQFRDIKSTHTQQFMFKTSMQKVMSMCVHKLNQQHLVYKNEKLVAFANCCGI